MIDRIVNYLKGVRAEIARVSWPTRSELISLTVLIVILMVIMTVYIWGVDGILSTLLKVFVRSG
ncbi:preprotein translocase subunit SecE [Candidatus Acetothermia bacterium]|nr:MAG: preprotein translocase subunit SecE [Candidatus Acetothermia bacterium]HHK66868.1 preprotein translocase subunit SecE [Candidatus Acetothermia bacterium]